MPSMHLAMALLLQCATSAHGFGSAVCALQKRHDVALCCRLGHPHCRHGGHRRCSRAQHPDEGVPQAPHCHALSSGAVFCLPCCAGRLMCICAEQTELAACRAEMRLSVPRSCTPLSSTRQVRISCHIEHQLALFTGLGLLWAQRQIRGQVSVMPCTALASHVCLEQPD